MSQGKPNNSVFASAVALVSAACAQSVGEARWNNSACTAKPVVPALAAAALLAATVKMARRAVRKAAAAKRGPLWKN